MDETGTILHEYAHYLVRNHGGFVYPRWFDEGFAEYLSGVQLSGDQFQVGLPPEDRVYGLERVEWIRPDEVLDPDKYENLDDIERSMFYGQSWALVHFLMNQDYGDSSFTQAMQHYMELASAGTAESDAFEIAFGIATGILWRDVKRYLKSCCTVFAIDLTHFNPDFNPVVRKMSETEIALELGRMALRMDNREEAQRWLEIAREDDATRAGAEAALGDILKFAGEFEQAQPHFDLAVELAPDDAYVQLDAAEFWMRRSEAATFPSERDTYFANATSHFTRAWNLDRTQPETYAMYGRLLMLDDTKHGTAIEMLQEAARLHPSSLLVRHMLVEAYDKADRGDDAVRTASLILHWGHTDSSTAEYAQEIIDRYAGDSPETGAAVDSADP